MFAVYKRRFSMTWCVCAVINAILSFHVTINCLPQHSIDEHTDYVCRRWYIVERLSKSMDLIELLNRRYKKQLYPLNFDSTLTLADPLVNNCLKKLTHVNSIVPLLQLWQQIRSYKYLTQATLPGDFSLLVYIWLRHCCRCVPLLNTHDEICNQLETSNEILVSWDVVQMLDQITRVTNYLKGKRYECLVSNRVAAKLSQKYVDIGTKDISLRFCLASRLKKTFDWLSIFKNKKISLFKTMAIRDQSTVVIDEYVTLHHPRTVTCYKEMAQTESLLPFIELWKQFRRFEEIHDVQFLKDFLKLVFVTYHYLFKGNLITRNLSIDHLELEMQSWSVHLNEYSLTQILDVIDEIEHSCDECKMAWVLKKENNGWFDYDFRRFLRSWWSPNVPVNIQKKESRA